VSGLLSHVKLSLVENFDDALAFREWMKLPREILGVDTETTGLSPEKDRVRLIQFGDENEGWALPWEEWRGLAAEVLDNYTGELVLHNSKFDIRQISFDLNRSVKQWPWHRTHDTMGMAHIADSQRAKGLKPLASQWVDFTAVAGQKTLDDGMHKNKWTWATVPITFPPYWQYAALDPVLTVYLYKHFKYILSEQRPLYDMEMGAIRVAAKMEEYGFLTDIKYSTTKAIELREYAESARSWMLNELGLDNPTPMKLTKYFVANNVPMLDKTTASGNQAMDKDVLKSIKHPLAETVLNMRKAEKLAGTYLENIVKFAGTDNVIHPGINTMAARTGRMSITEPALQTLPKKDPTVRRAFLPRPGSVLVSCDYDQIEARLTAHFSQDAGLIAAFMSDDDFFCVIASESFGYPVIKGMVERDLIKGVVYGKVYGASVAKMAETAGVPYVDMSKTNKAFETAFPGVANMQQLIIETGKRRKQAEGRGYVMTPYGRKLQSDPGKEYTLVNYLIQCHASEILKSKMIALDSALPDEVHMLVPVHDEVLFDVPEDMAQDVLHLIEETMKDDEYAVPITAGGDIMRRWWGDTE
jgi:DNA polymerase-1